MFKSCLTRTAIAAALVSLSLGAWAEDKAQPVAEPAPASKVEAAPADPLAGKVDFSEQPIVDKDSGLDPMWFKKGVFMEIYVRGYMDSNGDGKGDLKGLISKLDYIKSLGITGLWLMPITNSKDHDHGYAVVDYRGVEAQYGKLEDVDTLVAEAHKRGIGIIIDYVMNHSSIAHPLFDQTIMDKTSPYREWYVWSDTHPEGWNGYSGDPWTQTPAGWYYGVFIDSMPDFNLKNPKVVDWHVNNLKFWLNRGVDGFRFDAVGVYVENGKIGWENQPESYQIAGKIHSLLNQYSKRFMVCEAPTDPQGFSKPEACGSAFAFGMQKHIVKSVKFGRPTRELTSFLTSNPVSRMSTILTNHDSFAGTRLFHQFNGNEQEYKMATATLLTLPGTPFIYYGEEIGLSMAKGESYEDQEIRGPMSWTNNSANAGFSTKKRRLFRNLVENFETHNVEMEEKDPNSLLQYYRKMIALRNNNPVLSLGDFKLISEVSDKTTALAFERNYEGEKAVVVLNYGEKPLKVSIKLDPKTNKKAVYTPAWPEGAANVTADVKGVLTFTVPGLTPMVLKHK